VLEEELEVMVAGINERADLRFGALLQARGVKAKAVVSSWGSSRGEHAGELSKEDFRRAVIRLFKGLPPTVTRREKDQGAATERDSRPDGMEAHEEAALELVVDGSPYCPPDLGGSDLQTYLIPRFNYLLDLSEEGRPI
jgi:hypothetical protein